MTDSDSKLWTVEDVAEFLSVSRNRVYLMGQEDGDFPSIKIGRKVRFVPSAVKAWVESKGKKK